MVVCCFHCSSKCINVTSMQSLLRKLASISVHKTHGTWLSSLNRFSTACSGIRYDLSINRWLVVSRTPNHIPPNRPEHANNHQISFLYFVIYRGQFDVKTNKILQENGQAQLTGSYNSVYLFDFIQNQFGRWHALLLSFYLLTPHLPIFLIFLQFLKAR